MSEKTTYRVIRILSDDADFTSHRADCKSEDVARSLVSRSLEADHDRRYHIVKRVDRVLLDTRTGDSTMSEKTRLTAEADDLLAALRSLEDAPSVRVALEDASRHLRDFAELVNDAMTADRAAETSEGTDEETTRELAYVLEQQERAIDSIRRISHSTLSQETKQ